MKIDLVTIPFSAIATGGTLADVNLQGVESFAVLLEIASHGGTATTAFVDLVPRLGSTVPVATASSDAIGHPVDLTNQTGMFAFTRIGAPGAAKTQFIGNGFWIPNSLQEARIKATLTGAGHTITGNVHVLKRFI